jgi:hypothetical protein
VNRDKGKALLREGKRSEAIDCFQKSVDVSPEMALALIKECRSAGVECIVAPYEADSQLAYLSKEEIVDLVITEDSDLVVFGCRKVMFKLDDSGNGKLIETQHLGKANCGLVVSMPPFLHLNISLPPYPVLLSSSSHCGRGSQWTRFGTCVSCPAATTSPQCPASGWARPSSSCDGLTRIPIESSRHYTMRRGRCRRATRPISAGLTRPSSTSWCLTLEPSNRSDSTPSPATWTPPTLSSLECILLPVKMKKFHN